MFLRFYFFIIIKNFRVPPLNPRNNCVKFFKKNEMEPTCYVPISSEISDKASQSLTLLLKILINTTMVISNPKTSVMGKSNQTRFTFMKLARINAVGIRDTNCLNSPITRLIYALLRPWNTVAKIIEITMKGKIVLIVLKAGIPIAYSSVEALKSDNICLGRV